MSLYASYVSLSILASSRIPQLILRRRAPHFCGGFVTVRIRARLGLNTWLSIQKSQLRLRRGTLCPYKGYSSLLSWQANCVYILQLRNCANEGML
jgi:hypothetical protein